MLTRWLASRVRRAWKGVAGHYAIWVECCYMEPYGSERWAVRIRPMTGDAFEVARHRVACDSSLAGLRDRADPDEGRTNVTEVEVVSEMEQMIKNMGGAYHLTARPTPAGYAEVTLWYKRVVAVRRYAVKPTPRKWWKPWTWLVWGLGLNRSAEEVTTRASRDAARHRERVEASMSRIFRARL